MHMLEEGLISSDSRGLRKVRGVSQPGGPHSNSPHWGLVWPPRDRRRVFWGGAAHTLTSLMTCRQAPHGEMNSSCKSLGKQRLNSGLSVTRLVADAWDSHTDPCPANQVTPQQTTPDSQNHCVLEAGKATWQLATLPKAKSRWQCCPHQRTRIC